MLIEMRTSVYCNQKCSNKYINAGIDIIKLNISVEFKTLLINIFFGLLGFGVQIPDRPRAPQRALVERRPR